jgi:hypothetical protein
MHHIRFDVVEHFDYFELPRRQPGAVVVLPGLYFLLADFPRPIYPRRPGEAPEYFPKLFATRRPLMHQARVNAPGVPRQTLQVFPQAGAIALNYAKRRFSARGLR